MGYASAVGQLLCRLLFADAHTRLFSIGAGDYPDALGAKVAGSYAHWSCPLLYRCLFGEKNPQSQQSPLSSTNCT